MAKGVLNGLVRYRFNSGGFPCRGPPLLQIIELGECLVDAGGNHLDSRCPSEHPTDPADLLVDMRPAPIGVAHAALHRSQRDRAEIEGWCAIVEFPDVLQCGLDQPDFIRHPTVLPVILLGVVGIGDHHFPDGHLIGRNQELAIAGFPFPDNPVIFFPACLAVVLA